MDAVPIRPSRWLWAALAVGATLAVALRLRMLLVGRSLWLDEAALALNVCGRSFSDLLRPLDHDQAAPVGFLLLERASVVAFGPGEVALRLLPFLASLASLALLYRLCASSLGRWSGAVAVTLMGIMPGLFYYSGELKQYSSDVTAALLILTLAAGVLRDGLTAGRGLALGVAGGVAIWFSHPSVFVLAGAGTTLIVREGLARRYRASAALVAISACWLVSFAAEYFLFLKPLEGSEFLAEYWEAAFLKFPPTSPRDLRVYLAVGFGVFESMLHNAQSDVDLSGRMGVSLAAAWMIGVVVLYAGGRRASLALLTSPLLFAALGSSLHKYPLKSRMALFTAASTLPVIAGGIAGLMASRDGTKRSVGFVLLASTLLLPLAQGVQFLAERPRLHDARSVLAHLDDRWEPGDVVVVDRYSDLPFFYYRDYGRIAGLGRVAITPSGETLTDPDGLAREITRWRGCRRVWFLLDAALPDPINPSRSALKVLLDVAGVGLDSATSRRYSAHLYDFAATPGIGPGPVQVGHRAGSGQGPDGASRRVPLERQQELLAARRVAREFPTRQR